MRDKVTNDLVVSGKPKVWGSIFEQGTYLAKGTTDANGKVNVVVPPTTNAPNVDYIVIAKTTAFDDIKTYLVDPDCLYSADRVNSVNSGQVKKVGLHKVRLYNGKMVPCSALEFIGSYLAIVEPEYIDWTSEQEQYPIVLVAEEGDWDVTTGIEPPEGFIANTASLSVEVNNSIGAVQFTLTDVGSSWTSVGTTYTVGHKGKTEVRKHHISMFDKKPKLDNKLKKEKTR
jgi:hypothetical protein